jgi:hypothetical protein
VKSNEVFSSDFPRNFVSLWGKVCQIFDITKLEEKKN